MTTKKAKSWELATIRKNDKGDLRLVFDKSAKIIVNGQEADLGEYMMAYVNKKDKMLEDIQFRVNKGWMTEEQAEKARNTIEEKNVVGSVKVSLK
jgi:hypothetical protein